MATAVVKAQIQKQNVPLATLNGPDGKPVYIYMTKEHHQPLERMAKMINDLQARLTAAGL